MKKVLSFVLVLAMVLGSVAMVFATNDFADQATITNKEASAVLSAIGVIEGYTDGSFQPTKTLTRAEGAAIAARMVLGKAEAAKLTTVVAPFNDVPASHWAAGYVSYCVSQGYINGYGNGNFGPDDTLTVAQFGKMMLTLLGYKSENEGFVGDAWETNVGSVMVKAGLTDGVTMSGSNACAREVAAQVALNTLKGELVKYEGTPTTVSTGSVTVTTGQSAAKKDDWQAADKETYKAETKAGATSGPVRFMNRYQKDLSLAATANDAFGRPDTNDWKYKNVKVYTAKSTSNLIASYTTKQTYKTLYSLLNDVNANKASVRLIAEENGVASANIVAADVQTWLNGKKNDTSNPINRNGVQIEVYFDAKDATNGGAYDDGTVRIVAYDYYLVKASADYNANNESVKIDWRSAKPAGVASEIAKKDFDVTNVKEDDYLILTVAGTDIKSVAPATKVTGNISGYTVDSNITIDGTKYTKSGNFKTLTGAAKAFEELKTGSDVTLVLDPNNFVMETTGETAQNQFVFIYKFGNAANLDEDDKAIAYFVDGTRQIITIDSKPAGAAAQGWFNYSVKSNGKYILSAVGGSNSEVAYNNAYAANFNSGKVNYTGTYNASGETIFLVKKGTDTKVSVYTGYKNAPGITVAATVGFGAVEKDGYSRYVFIDAKNESVTGANTSDYMVVYKKGTSMDQVVGSDNTNYYSYGKIILNGKAGTVEFAKSNVVPVNAYGFYKDLSYDTDGRVDGAKAVTGADGPATGFEIDSTNTTKGAISYKSGVLSLANITCGVSDTAKAFVVHGDTVDEVSVSSAKGNLDETGSYTIFVKYADTSTTNTKIDAVFFIKN